MNSPKIASWVAGFGYGLLVAVSGALVLWLAGEITIMNYAVQIIEVPRW